MRLRRYGKTTELEYGRVRKVTECGWRRYGKTTELSTDEYGRLRKAAGAATEYTHTHTQTHSELSTDEYGRLRNYQNYIAHGLPWVNAEGNGCRRNLGYKKAPKAPKGRHRIA
jgi:hypothetical protein